MKELQKITSKLRQEENIKIERLKREEQQRKIKIEAQQEVASELEEENLVDSAAAAEPVAVPSEPVSTEELFTVRVWKSKACLATAIGGV